MKKLSLTRETLRQLNPEESSQVAGGNISIINTVLCRSVLVACIPTTITQQASICHSNCLACEIPAGY